MRHFDKIKEILSSLDPGRPVVKIMLSGNNTLRFTEEQWSINVPGQSFHSDLVSQFARRKRVDYGDDKGYVVDHSNTIEAIKSHVVHNFMSVVSESCPNKEPRRTSLYKNMNSLVRAINHSSASTEALALMFDIYEYYTSVTKELSLKNESNSVHRKNIYYLINALEQKHGRKTNGN